MSLKKVFARAIIGFIRLYQLLFHYKTHRCRFIPSCSVYAIDAILKYGVARGFWLAFKRVLRCRPGFGKFKNCGFDPVS
jgi:putative membrane protein insertion efficiency factor